MRNSFSLILLFLCRVCYATLLNGYHIQPINNPEALPDKEVHCVFEDSKGYIWFGTSDGFCRYDGYSVKTFKSSPEAPNLLQDNMVLTINEDRQDRLWIGTNMGLSIYDRKTGKIMPVAHQQLAGLYIRVIYADRGRMWVGTEYGLYLYDETTEEFRAFLHNPKDAATICGNKVRALCEDDAGNLWIGTYDNGLCKIDKTTLQVTRYPAVSTNNCITALFIDRDNTLWAGAWRDGICKVVNRDDPAKTTYVRMGTLTRYERHTNSIIQEEDGHILFGTGLGIDVVTAPYAASDYHYSEEGLLPGFPNYEINRLYLDNSGIIWIATKNNGVFQLFKEKKVFTNYLYETLDDLRQPASMHAFYERENDILIGVDKVGIARFDKKTGKISSSQRDGELSKIPFPMGNIRAIVKHPHKDELYLGSEYGGFYICRLEGEKITSARQYLNPWTANWLVGNVVEATCCDSEGNVWIGGNYGFNIITPSGEKLIYGPRELSKGIHCQTIMEDDKGRIWMGTTHNGVIRVEKDTLPGNLSFSEYTPQNGKIKVNNIKCLYQNSRKEIFAGTKGGGLCFYNEQYDCFEPVKGMESFSNDAVVSIIESNQLLYMGTNRGLLQFDPHAEENRQLMVFTVSDGLLDNIFNPNAVMRSSDGKLFFGTPRGFVSFDPRDIKMEFSTANVVISDIKIFHNSYDKLPEKQQKRISPGYHPYHTGQIVLSHKEYNFGIEFATLSYRYPEKNRYMYMLEGFDREWNYVSSANRTAYYTNMKSGRYRFLVKSTHENSFMNQQPEVLEIKVLPPPYKSWWAYLIYTVLFLLMCYVAIRFLRYRTKVKILDLEYQKNQELAQEKLKFFTNISHELLTPLTIISCSVEELQRKYNGHGNAWKAIKGNIFRLNRLLEQILEFRKAEKGKLKLNVSYGDAGRFIIDLCRDNFTYYEQSKHIEFVYRSSPEQIPAWFDRNIVDMIMYNLISNAFKYNRKEGQVSVYVETEDSARRFLIIRVGNTGDGFSAGQLEELFKRFQSFSYVGREKQGNGIGLYLTKSLVELHQGSIKVSSTPGNRTEFCVRIPIYKEAYAIDAKEDEPQVEDFLYNETPAEEDADTAGKLPYTLLVIEDDTELLDAVTRFLSESYTVITATDGKTGLETARKKNPDLIISDVMLPGINGFELCRLIKEDLSVSHIAVILLTAKVSATDKIYGLESGADSYITKPFRFDVLVAQIRSLLLNRQKITDKFRKELKFELPADEQASPDRLFLEKAVGVVEKNLGDAEFNVQEFSEAMNTSNSMLYRKLKALTGMSPSEFIRSIRMKKACILLQDRQYNISEIAYKVGFNEPKYFSKCFKEEVGKTPSEYQNG